jgi:beta-galactosidase/beta-glucuronidase
VSAGGARKFGRSIVVPYCFESKLSGIGDTSYHPWVWYRRAFTTPTEWKGRRLLLHFGAVDYRAMVWVNGKFAGNHEGGFTPFVLDQGFWPESVLTPPTDEAIQYDIKTTKEMGFNGARKHQKVEDPRYLYWADRLGFLVSGEMVNAQVFDEATVERFTKEWMDVVQRDYNHPSVIIWAPINESWGVPDVARDPRQQNYIKSLYVLTKTLDNTRLVIDNEGWEHTALTDLYAVHNYARTGDLLYEAYKDIGGKPGERVPHLVPGSVYNGSPFYLSEFGGIAYIPAGANVPAEAWGYSGVEKTAEDALARLRGLYEALRKMPAFIGICYTQRTDVEQEVNGLMTVDRKPKFDSKALRDINQMLR